MTDNWLPLVPNAVYFLLGLGSLAGATLALRQLWRSLVPDPEQRIEHDIEAIRADIAEIKKRVTAVELDLAHIDQPAMVKRFDTLEGKIDKLFDFLLERFAEEAKDTRL